ncbi:YheT family hydrolase [Microscilla marina]|uniref:Alpha/beta hydrolase fold n=1 Tax=Microscilla marina ATCC 23134 TaxID=313606 RepID=A1ZM83_MICM2|nr:alpha/beta fold hydrolase [Microscilla marina]EAY28615.1 alpha/beta hydrolase fold [Microscilla marina ATCC 23134]
MPVISESSYRSPFWLPNRHLQTIYPNILRRIEGVHYQRERIDTPDGDFLDLDWCKSPSGQPRLVIMSHGLEGDTHRTYMKGMVRAFRQQNWDVLTWNYRGCSGENNRLIKAYHSGATYDLATVVQHALSLNVYQEVVMVGFSLGGNLTLKYLGEQGAQLSELITKSVIFSAPVDLAACADEISKPHNFIYAKRFLRTLKQKLKAKIERYPDAFAPGIMQQIKTLRDFDNLYTAPVHGFENAQDYYKQCSARYFLDTIAIPTLIVNAQNDSFLAPTCYPKTQVEKLDWIFLEIPRKGGHCGFAPAKPNDLYWSEQRALEFVQG